MKRWLRGGAPSKERRADYMCSHAGRGFQKGEKSGGGVPEKGSSHHIGAR